MNKLALRFLICSSIAQSDAAIIYRDDIDLSLFSLQRRDIEFDIDDNTVPDLTFRVQSGDFNLIGNGANRIIALPAAPPDLGANITPLWSGVELNQDVESGLFWYAPGLQLGSANFLSCRNIGCIGEWANLTAFLGVEFDIEGEIHYGWLEIEAPFGSIPGGNLLRLAYEDEPGKAIMTGAIPEPSTGMMIVIASSILSFLRRRR